MTKKTEPKEPQKPRVLVAEDEALIRLDLVELLTDEGYEVVGQASEHHPSRAMEPESYLR